MLCQASAGGRGREVHIYMYTYMLSGRDVCLHAYIHTYMYIYMYACLVLVAEDRRLVAVTVEQVGAPVVARVRPAGNMYMYVFMYVTRKKRGRGV